MGGGEQNNKGAKLSKLQPPTLSPVTYFYRSQVGGESVINYGYTDMPWKLLFRDIYYFFVYAWALPWILWPLYPFGSNEMDELYPDMMNIFCVVMHGILIILQLLFVLALPLMLIFPLWMGITATVAFMSVNWLLCRLLNGSENTYRSDEKYAKPLPEHEHEAWVFLNGVAVGKHWMRMNLDRLAITFGRPILGIHNKTSGIVFDVIECLIQRNFGYATNDVRICYRLLKDILYDPSKSKVIFVLHSQGGIEGSMVLDWLLQETPQDLLSKLEVYTFGNAANHFNNPHRHAISQRLTWTKPLDAVNATVTETTVWGVATSPDAVEKTARLPPLRTDSSSMSSTRTFSAAKDRAIGHIEHYAHTTDFVSIWGILHFATNRMASPQLPRFLGRLFSRSDGRGGHLLCQHYLDGMFPLKRDPETGDFIGADDDSEFMNEVIKFGKEGTAMENVREAFEISYGGTSGFGTGEISTPVEVYDSARKRNKHDVQVKELSRLWLYRNGRSPPVPPAMMITELVGVVRNATM